MRLCQYLTVVILISNLTAPVFAQRLYLAPQQDQYGRAQQRQPPSTQRQPTASSSAKDKELKRIEDELGEIIAKTGGRIVIDLVKSGWRMSDTLIKGLLKLVQQCAAAGGEVLGLGECYLKEEAALAFADRLEIFQDISRLKAERLKEIGKEIIKLVESKNIFWIWRGEKIIDRLQNDIYPAAASLLSINTPFAELQEGLLLGTLTAEGIKERADLILKELKSARDKLEDILKLYDKGDITLTKEQLAELQKGLKDINDGIERAKELGDERVIQVILYIQGPSKEALERKLKNLKHRFSPGQIQESDTDEDKRELVRKIQNLQRQTETAGRKNGQITGDIKGWQELKEKIQKSLQEHGEKMSETMRQTLDDLIKERERLEVAISTELFFGMSNLERTLVRRRFFIEMNGVITRLNDGVAELEESLQEIQEKMRGMGSLKREITGLNDLEGMTGSLIPQVERLADQFDKLRRDYLRGQLTAKNLIQYLNQIQELIDDIQQRLSGIELNLKSSLSGFFGIQLDPNNKLESVKQWLKYFEVNSGPKELIDLLKALEKILKKEEDMEKMDQMIEQLMNDSKLFWKIITSQRGFPLTF